MLGQQSNVQRYGLRLYNPLLPNVDDTYHASIDSATGSSMISHVHLSKVAIRLYINIYTTTDGSPPRNIKLIFVSIWELWFRIGTGDMGNIHVSTSNRTSASIFVRHPLVIRVLSCHKWLVLVVMHLCGGDLFQSFRWVCRLRNCVLSRIGTKDMR
jgi:hypothetical protein